MNRNLRSMLLAALFAAALALLAQIAIPGPGGIPLTLQTFCAALAGYALGAGWGAAAIGVYLLLGAAGLPVFAGFHGGAQVLVNVTGGFLWGFFALAVLCGLPGRNKTDESGKASNPLLRSLLPPILGLLGLILCHACGVLQFALVSGRNLSEAFLLASAPYLIKDAISVLAAWLLAGRLRKALPR